MDRYYVDVQFCSNKHRPQFLLAFFDLTAEVHKYERAAVWFLLQIIDQRRKCFAAHVITNLKADLYIPLLEGAGIGQQLVLWLGPWHVGSLRQLEKQSLAHRRCHCEE